MELSSRAEYALIALMAIATSYTRHEPVKIGEITANQDIPDRYLEQIMSNLRRAGLIASQRGARGGYELAKEPWQINTIRCDAGDRRTQRIQSQGTFTSDAREKVDS